MNNIRRLREARGMSQFQLAVAIGVTPVTVGLWESGKYFPSPGPRARLAEFFGVADTELGLPPITETGQTGRRGSRFVRTS